MAENITTKCLLPHHEQQPLCTTRLPYRQGKKLTAVKTYTITTESNHLLIFGVPSINLRQETKSLLHKFGKLIHLSLLKDYQTEQFTETYHAHFDTIKEARIAKKMLDGKSFYGSILHICYAPEKETVQETKSKLIQRQKDVLYRLRNLQKEKTDCQINLNSHDRLNSHSDSNILNTTSTCHDYTKSNTYDKNMDYAVRQSSDKTYCTGLDYLSQSCNDEPSISKDSHDETSKSQDIHRSKSNKKLNMGVNNVIYLNKNKRKINSKLKNVKKSKVDEKDCTVIDCTSTERELITDIRLNYSNFGNEIIKKVEEKPLNTIKFNNKI